MSLNNAALLENWNFSQIFSTCNYSLREEIYREWTEKRSCDEQRRGAQRSVCFVHEPGKTGARAHSTRARGETKAEKSLHDSIQFISVQQTAVPSNLGVRVSMFYIIHKWPLISSRCVPLLISLPPPCCGEAGREWPNIESPHSRRTTVSLIKPQCNFLQWGKWCLDREICKKTVQCKFAN